MKEKGLVAIAIMMGMILSSIFYTPFHERYQAQDMKVNEEFTLSQQNVLFTSFWELEENSNHITSSGLKPEDFSKNELGWYEYNGKVVLGAATNLCLKTNTGACKAYKEVPNEYALYNLYDEIIIEVNGVLYEGIVLDSCGACMVSNENEADQRYDIFVADEKYSVGKIEGSVLRQNGNS